MKPILSQRQITFLEQFGRNPDFIARFYFTGGTPLAAFYLHHRYSEDLDFFSEQEVDSESISLFLQLLKAKLGFTSIDFQQNMNRNLFFVHFPDEIIKMEFTYFPFPRIEHGQPKYGIEVDSVIDIAVNKLFSIYQRTVQRDYIDLYLLCTENKFTIQDLILKAKVKFDWHIDPLQLGTQFMKATEAKDPPRLIKPLEPKEWQDFFENAALELKSKIIK